MGSVYIKEYTQEKLILEYIKKKGCITTLKAVKELGITQAPARIWGLKKRGINIKTRWKQVKNRFGKTRRIVEYYIAEEGAV